MAVLAAGCSSSSATSSHTATTAQPPPAAAGRIVRRIPVGRYPDGVVAGFGSLWTANLESDTVSRVDPATGRVIATIPAGPGPISLLVTHGAVWVADYNGRSLTAIDPRTNRRDGVVRVGTRPVSLVRAGDTLWALNQVARTATLIDLSTRRVRATVAVHAGSGFAAAADGLVWVPDFKGGSGRVVAIDPATHRIVHSVRVAGGTPLQVVFGLGSGWVGNGAGDTVTRFDPATGTVRSVIHLAADAGSLLATPRAIWVASYLGDTLTRIGAGGRIEGTVPTAAGPNGFAVDRGRLWVTESGAGDLAEVAPPAAGGGAWP
jgi:YVTN family beta-propeller protein